MFVITIAIFIYFRSDLISQHEEQTNKQTYHYIILINEQINKLD